MLSHERQQFRRLRELCQVSTQREISHKSRLRKSGLPSIYERGKSSVYSLRACPPQ